MKSVYYILLCLAVIAQKASIAQEPLEKYIDLTFLSDKAYANKKYDSAISYGKQAIDMAIKHHFEYQPFTTAILNTIGKSYQQLIKPNTAHQYFMLALENGRKHKHKTDKNQALINLNELHKQIQEKNWSFNYLPTTTTISKFISLQIINIDTLGSGKLYLTIDGGSNDGIKDTTKLAEVFSRYIQKTQRQAFTFFGKATIDTITENRFTAILSPPTKDTVQVGDMVYVEAQVPLNFESMTFKKYLINNVVFRNSYRERIINRRFFQYFYDSLVDRETMDVLKQALDEIVETLGEDTATNALYGMLMTEGIFKGMNFMRGMHEATHEEIQYFLNFVAEYPGKYIANDFKFAEIFATWVINNTPLTANDIKRFILSKKTASEREQAAGALLKQINNQGLATEWTNNGLQEAYRENAIDALQLSLLLEAYGKAGNQPSALGWSNYIAAICEQKKGQSTKAADLFKTATQWFTTAKDQEGLTWVNNGIKKLQATQKISLHVQSGHLLSYSVAMSNNPRYFATGSQDNSIKIWDALLGKEVISIKAHEDEVSSINYSRNGRYLVSCAKDSTIKLWNGFDYSLLLSIKTKKPEIISLISPDHKYIVSAGRDSLIKLWDINTGKLLHQLAKHKGRINDLHYSLYDSRYLYSAGADSMVYVWNMDSLQQTGWIREKSRVVSVRESPDGKYIATVTSDSNIHVRNNDNKYSLFFADSISTKRSTYFTSYNTPEFSPDGRLLVYGVKKKNNPLRVVALAKGLYKDFPLSSGDTTMMIESSHFSADGNYMVQHYNGLVGLSLFNFTDFNFDNAPKSFTKKEFKYYNYPPFGISFAADNTGLIAVTSAIVNISFANAKVKRLIYGNVSFYNFCLSLKNKHVTYYEEASRLFHIYNPTTSEVVKSLKYSGKEDISTALSNKAESRFYLSSKDGTIQGFDTSKSDALFTSKYTVTEDDGIRIIRYNNFKQVLYAITYEGKLLTIHATTGKLLDSMSIKNATDVASTKTGFYVLTSDRKLLHYHSNTKKLIDIHKLPVLATNPGIMELSNHQQYLVIQSSNRHISLFDVQKNKLLQTKEVHQAISLGLSISADDKWLATSGLDNTIKLYHFPSLQPVMTIYTPMENDYVFCDTNGYYLSTKRGLEGIVFNYNDNAYGFEQFDLQFNRPDKILRQLPNADTMLIKSYYAAYQKRLRQLGLNVQQFETSIHLPVTKIRDKFSVRPTTASATYQFTADFYDAKFAIQSLQVLVNNSPVYGKEGKQLLQPSTQHTASFTVTLGRGNNNIKVYCVNEKGIASLKESFDVLSTYAFEKPATTYFIGIGVSNYKDSSNNLKYAVKDVRDLAITFGTYYTNHVIDTLLDEQATKENILALKSKLQQTTVNDRVIIAVTGHGLLSDSLDFYYGTYDVDFNQPAKRGLKYEWLEGLLDDIPARQKLLLIDACHSGALDKETLLAVQQKDNNQSASVDATTVQVKVYGTKGAAVLRKEKKVAVNSVFDLMQTQFADVSNSNGTVVISAAGGLEFAYESPEWNNGVFTYAIRRGVENQMADIFGNYDKRISVQELLRYVSTSVPELTKGKQKPISRRENLDFDWLIR
jgi:WD40 repeat protein